MRYLYFVCPLVCSKLTDLIIILLMLFCHPKQSSLTETGTLNVRGASAFIQKATQQNKLKHTKTEKKTNENKDVTNGNEETWQEKR